MFTKHAISNIYNTQYIRLDGYLIYLTYKKIVSKVLYMKKAAMIGENFKYLRLFVFVFIKK